MRKNIFTQILILSIVSVLLTYCGSKPDQETKVNSADSTQVDSTKQMDGEGKGDEAEKKEEIEAIPVEVIEVGRGDISNYILLSSNLETETMADVYARMQGIVEKISKEEGQIVAKGEVLLELEATQYALAEEKARLEYLRQESTFKRLETMYKESLLSSEEFENAKYTLEAAEVQWDEAKLNLDYMKIRAPISGRVGERIAKIGQRIQPTDKIFSVIDNSQVIAVVYVPEKNLDDLKIGQKAKVFSDYLQDRTFKSWIKRISPVVDPASGTFKVTLGVENIDNKLRPGMFVNTHIILNTHKDVILIPKTAIVYENQFLNVFVVRDSLAHKVRLQPGYEDNEKIESLDGIESGEKIIVIGQAGMKDKAKVDIVTERTSPLAATN